MKKPQALECRRPANSGGSWIPFGRAARKLVQNSPALINWKVTLRICVVLRYISGLKPRFLVYCDIRTIFSLFHQFVFKRPMKSPSFLLQWILDSHEPFPRAQQSKVTSILGGQHYRRSKFPYAYQKKRLAMSKKYWCIKTLKKWNPFFHDYAFKKCFSKYPPPVTPVSLQNRWITSYAL